MSENTLGIYIHIPFCRAKCNYCAFVSEIGDRAKQQTYVAALCGEIIAAGGDFKVPVDSVFFGGGTPTVLSVEELSAILNAVRDRYAVTADAEISIEANPGAVDKESLKTLRRSGFNRLSLGAQSFDDRVLTAAGRIHRADDISRTFVAARDAGFSNVSLDLMFGLPLQDPAGWQETLRQAVALRPDHISAYGLKLEEGTPMCKGVAAGNVFLPDEQEEETMYDTLNIHLPENGYSRYEISNYSKEGHECRHNLKYWNYQSYRGFGVSAHSFDGLNRWSNTENLAEYIERVAKGESPQVFCEALDRPTAMAEMTFLSLRTSRGLSEDAFVKRFDIRFAENYRIQLGRLESQGLMRLETGHWILTERGKKLGNQVFMEFLP